MQNVFALDFIFKSWIVQYSDALVQTILVLLLSKLLKSREFCGPGMAAAPAALLWCMLTSIGGILYYYTKETSHCSCSGSLVQSLNKYIQHLRLSVKYIGKS